MKKRAILILFLIASFTVKSQELSLPNYAKFKVKGAVKISSDEASSLRKSITIYPQIEERGGETFFQVGNVLFSVKESPIKEGIKVLKAIKKLYEHSDNSQGNSSEIKTVNGNNVVVAYRIREFGSSIKFSTTNSTGTLSLSGKALFKLVDTKAAKEAVEELLNTLQFIK